MNIADIIIIIIVLILSIISIRKLYNSYLCSKAKGVCAGCALSGSCFKENTRFKVK